MSEQTRSIVNMPTYLFLSETMLLSETVRVLSLIRKWIIELRVQNISHYIDSTTIMSKHTFWFFTLNWKVFFFCGMLSFFYIFVSSRTHLLPLYYARLIHLPSFYFWLLHNLISEAFCQILVSQLQQLYVDLFNEIEIQIRLFLYFSLHSKLSAN